MIPHWLAVTLAIAAVWFVISLPLSLSFGRRLQAMHDRYPLDPAASLIEGYLEIESQIEED